MTYPPNCKAHIDRKIIRKSVLNDNVLISTYINGVMSVGSRVFLEFMTRVINI
jgi:hypothetical protein